MKDVATPTSWLSLPESVRRRFAFGASVEQNGTVDIFRALDTETRRQVAIKACTNANRECIDALRAEYQRVATLQHENIVRVYEFFLDGGKGAFTMEWIHGARPLHWLWQDESSGAEETTSHDATIEYRDNLLDLDVDVDAPTGARGYDNGLRNDRFEHLATQLFDALAHLRSQRLVHGDIKPANLKVEAGGRLVLLDFGVAFVPDLDDDASALTPTYAAPEVLAGGRPTYASDVYSAAVVLYELATRERFDRRARKSFHHRLRELRRAGVDRGMCRALALALEPNPTARPLSHEAQRWFARRRLRRLAFLQRPPALPGERAATAHQIFLSLYDRRDEAILLSAQPGGGKTSVATAVAAQWAQIPDAFSVWVTCRRAEQRPFQALLSIVEAVIDALDASAPHSDDPDADDRAERLPSETMRRVFASARVLDHARRNENMHHHVLHQALDELAVLLDQLSTERDILIVVDDAQWIDIDSMAALKRILARHPAPRIALLACGPRGDAVAAAITELVRDGHRTLHRVSLGNLSESDAVELLRAEFPETTSNTELAHLSRVAGGNPLILGWSARWLAEQGKAPSSIPSLGSIIHLRLQALSPDERIIATLLAVANTTLPTIVLEQFIASDIQTTMRILDTAGLVSAPDPRHPDQYAIGHERLAHAIRASVSETEQQRVMCALAPVAAAHMQRRPEVIARVLLRTDNATEARPWLLRAARQARQSFALARAVELYEEVIRLSDGPERLHFHLELAETLEQLGSIEDAAQHYMHAARYDEEHDAVTHQLHAAELLFTSGRDVHANTILQHCFRTLACRPYKSTADSIRLALQERRAFSAWMTHHAPQELVGRKAARDPWHSLRIEAHRIGANVFGQRDIVEGMFHHAESLRLLRQGASIEHVRSVLTTELAFAALPGPLFTHYVDRLQYVLENLHAPTLPGSGIEELRFRVMMGTAEMSMGRLVPAQDQFQQASLAFFGDYVRAPWLGLTASYLYAAMSARNFEVQRAIAISDLARRRFLIDDDAHFAALFALRVDCYLALVRNAPGESRRLMARYDPDAPRLSSFWWYTAMLTTAMYEGNAASAIRAAEAPLLGMMGSALGFAHYIGLELAFAFGRALLDALHEPHSRAEDLRWRALARTIIGLLGRWKTPQSHIYRESLRLTLALQQGDSNQALIAYNRVQRSLGCPDGRGLKLASRHALGVHGLGLGLTPEEDAYLASEGVQSPHRMLRMMIPSQRMGA